MYCPQCGKNLGKTISQFCKHCGADLSKAAPTKKKSARVKAESVANVVSAEGNAATGDLHPHPWRRYFARATDLWMIALVLGIAMELIVPAFLEQIPDSLFGLLICLVMLPYEAYTVSTWQRTVGKWLLSIRVTKAGGTSLTIEEGFRRSLLVLWRGMGLGLPLVSFVTNIHQFNALKKKGTTSWDEELGTTVTFEPLKPVRVIAIVILLVAFFFLIAIGTTV